SRSEYPFHLDGDKLRIGSKMIGSITSISDHRLTLKFGDTDYNYYRLKQHSLPFNEVQLRKNLIKNKWILNESSLEFTNDSGNIENSFKVIEYQAQKKFFGVYLTDSFHSNLFLTLIIDGKPMEFHFRVANIKDSEIELETAEGKKLEMHK
ncbi:hypothetical protein DBR11_26020, partial [Pedobacter sp. HMWF019]|uniref:hypothetical protein n=1 Tax=Pedobacter sp. HMWF019 TaxID=2056856 RepID=UPI000D468831